jgi:hypothetical protein
MREARQVFFFFFFWMEQSVEQQALESIASLLEAGEEVGAVAELFGGRSLSDMQQQPAVLSEQCRALREDSEQLIFDNYRAFLHTGVAVASTRRVVSATRHHLSAALQHVQPLVASAVSSREAAERAAVARGALRLAMQHCPQLLELLELPALLQTALRAQHTQHALLLLELQRRAALLHPQLTLLRSTAHEADCCAAQLRLQVTDTLASDCDMDTTVRAVDLLRRLDPDQDELALRLLFLRCRARWMARGGPPAGDARALASHVEKLRSELLFVATQYRAAFGAADVAGGAHALWEFAFVRVHEFVQALSSLLGAAEGGQVELDADDVAQLHEQAMYAGAALARVGLDARVLLQPPFAQCLSLLLKRRLHYAVVLFSDSLRTHDWRLQQSVDDEEEEQRKAQQNQQQQQVDGQEEQQSTPSAFASIPSSSPAASSSSSSGLSSVSPPTSLLRHPPLALLCNDVCWALSALRSAPLLSLRAPLAPVLRDSLQRARAALSAWELRCPRDARMGPAFADMLHLFDDALVPFALKAFAYIFEK